MGEQALIAEKIPGDNHLYRRVSNGCYDALSGKCTEGAFLLRTTQDEKYLSVDWAERTKLEISCLDPNTRKKYKIAELQVVEPIKLGLLVEHKPKPRNSAYAGISGKDLHDEVKRLEIASQLAAKSIMLLP